MLTLKLQELDFDKVIGIYKIYGIPNKMPKSALKLHPAAAHSFILELQDQIVVSDVFRTAESSLKAVQAGRGAKAPGYSGHNYGFSIDIDVTQCLKNLHFVGKDSLDAYMEHRGWFCHRTDHQRVFEEWHYNYFGVGFDVGKVKTTSGFLEDKIQKMYGDAFEFDSSAEVQEALASLKLYGGEIDDKFGPRSKEALKAFQRTWKLPDTGQLNEVTARTLAYVTAKIDLTPADKL